MKTSWLAGVNSMEVRWFPLMEGPSKTLLVEAWLCIATFHAKLEERVLSRMDQVQVGDDR